MGVGIYLEACRIAANPMPINASNDIDKSN